MLPSAPLHGIWKWIRKCQSSRWEKEKSVLHLRAMLTFDYQVTTHDTEGPFFFFFCTMVFEWECPPPRFICLNTGSPVVVYVWERLGLVDLLEEVCHWSWALNFQKHRPFPTPPFMFVNQIWTLSYCASDMPAAMLSAMLIMDSNPWEL